MRAVSWLIIAIVSVHLHANAQQRILPAEPPGRPSAVVAGALKVRLTAEAAPYARNVFAQHGLTIEREILPYNQSLRARSSNAAKVRNLQEALAVEDRLLRSYVVTYANTSIPPERMISTLRVGCGAIECAAPWCVAELAGEPNDPMIDRQQMLKTIQAFDAWDVEAGSDTVIIGISDSGLMMDHEDLRDKLFARTTEIPDNGIDDDGNGFIDDYRGYNFCATPETGNYGNATNARNSHGTGVGGICAATVNNGVGISGVVKNCRIFPLRTMPDNSTGIVYGYESIMYCALNGIHVVNCSWGSQSQSCIDQDVVAYAIARGTAVVAAAGNHNSAAPFYPASYRGVLGVGVTNPGDGVIEMTGRGPTVDVMAPGHDSWTTNNDGGYFGFCCTSGSAPIAAAIVAMVRSKHPALSPTEACAIVRDAVDERPWTSIPERIDALLLPRGRVNALRAVTALPDTLVSIEVDSVTIRTSRADGRWSVGDTIHAEVHLHNVLAPWSIDTQQLVALVHSGAPGLRPVTEETNVKLFADRDAHVNLPSFAFVVERETDTAEYAIVDLRGGDGNNRDIIRRVSFAIIPAPAFTTLANSRVRVSIGDRARIGNTDLARGQGVGFTYDQWCGQLFEGGLMVSANGRVVDAVRAVRGANDHFRPQKRFTEPEASRGIVTDADAPDSMRLGVQVELDWHLDTEQALLTVDATVTNHSSTSLHNLAVAWFYDWDLGIQPANNRTDRNGAQQMVYSIDPMQPTVLLEAWSYHSDATAILCGIDNTTTYGGFPASRKLALLTDPDGEQYDGVNDVAAIVGMRFTSPVPPGHRRMFRHIVAMDTSWMGAQTIRYSLYPESAPVDTLLAGVQTNAYPVPTDDVLYVPSGFITFSPATYEIYDALGRMVKQITMENVTGGEVILTVDVRDLPIGAYRMRLVDMMRTRIWPFVVSR